MSSMFSPSEVGASFGADCARETAHENPMIAYDGRTLLCSVLAQLDLHGALDRAIFRVDHDRLQFAGLAWDEVEPEVWILTDREIDLCFEDLPAGVAHLDTLYVIRGDVELRHLIARQSGRVRMLDHELCEARLSGDHRSIDFELEPWLEGIEIGRGA